MASLAPASSSVSPSSNLQVLVEVLAFELREGHSSKTGKAYSMGVCQCLVHGDKLLVGELVLPKDHPAPKRGFYRAEFEAGVGFDKKIGGFLKTLTRVSAPVFPKEVGDDFDQVSASLVPPAVPLASTPHTESRSTKSS